MLANKKPVALFRWHRQAATHTPYYYYHYYHYYHHHYHHYYHYYHYYYSLPLLPLTTCSSPLTSRHRPPLTLSARRSPRSSGRRTSPPPSPCRVLMTR